MADTKPTDGPDTPAQQPTPANTDPDRNMRDALGPEMGSDVVESAGAIAAPQPRSVIRWVLIAVAAIFVLQVLAAFVFPPRGHDGEPYQYPTTA